MKRTLTLLLVLAVGAALAIGAIVAPAAPSTYVKTATGHILPRAAVAAKVGAVKRFTQAFVEGPGTATVRLVLPDGKTADLLTFTLPDGATVLTPVQISVRVGLAHDAAKLAASINPEELANEP